MPTDLIPRARLSTLLSTAKNHHIAIIGDAMLDIYLTGDVERISPEAPVPVVRVRHRRYALGGAANVAQNVCALGAAAHLVATVGTDEPAERLRDLLAKEGGTTNGLVSVKRPTTTKTRVVARAQQVVRVDEEIDDDCSPAEIAKLEAAIVRAVRECDALILEDYNKGVLVVPVIEQAIAAATKKGIPVVVDPKYRNFFAYKGATIFKPNRRELEAALGAAVDVDHPKTLPGLVERLGVEAILLTLSERGMALIERDRGPKTEDRRPKTEGRRPKTEDRRPKTEDRRPKTEDRKGAKSDSVVHRIPTTARDVYDVVGAGDTVTAYLAAMLAGGATALEAAIIANFAAGVEVGKLGAATVSTEEVLAAYDAHGRR
jgi:D-glycero-beta-D-manno-heptose-7-phosphate kinase